jgi:hypothetical protein
MVEEAALPTDLELKWVERDTVSQAYISPVVTRRWWQIQPSPPCSAVGGVPELSWEPPCIVEENTQNPYKRL